MLTLAFLVGLELVILLFLCCVLVIALIFDRHV